MPQEIAIKNYSRFGDFVMLTKFRLSSFVVISSVLAYLVVAGANFDITTLLLLGIGGLAMTGAANALNQILERDFDKLMTRTQNRPLAAGRMKLSAAVLFSGLMLLTGSMLLAMINPLTALLSMISLITYSFVYTPLKRYSTLAVSVGAIPGALPVLMGTTAFSGTLTTIGIVLFAVQFLWQFPHFWAIGFLSFDDYKKAGYKLLPVNKAGNINRKLGLHSFLYALILIPISVAPFFIGDMTLVPSILIGICGILYAATSMYFYMKHDRKSALMLMFSSFFYLPLVLSFYLIG